MRKLVLGVAAAATLLAAWFAPDQDGGVVGPAAATTREPAVASPARPSGDTGANATNATNANNANNTNNAGNASNGAATGAAGGAASNSAVASTDANGAPAPQHWLDLQIHPRVNDDELGNLFAKQSWQPDAPKKVLPPQVIEAAQPTRAATTPSGAPPLPFQFMGRFVEDGKSAYFLQQDGRNVVARPGEKIDDNYLLESAANGALQFIYLPLNERQTLAVGDNN